MNDMQIWALLLAIIAAVLTFMMITALVLFLLVRRGGASLRARLRFLKAPRFIRLPVAWKGKTIWYCTILVCASCVIFSAVALSLYVFSFFTPDAEIRASAKNNVNYEVYYLDNNFFGNDARPDNLQYLLSFTDFITIENAFSAEFSQETDMTYQYKVTETLLIKHVKSSDSNTNAAVFEQKTTLSSLRGGMAGSRISWDGTGTDAPGGVYIIEPRKYIDIYRQFVKEQQKQMVKEDVTSEKLPEFSAEVLVDFTYTIRAGEGKINQTLTRGVSIPLSTEVFGIKPTGASEFEVSAALREFKMPGPAGILPLVFWFSAHVLGISYSSRQLAMAKDKNCRKVDKILKKYADEIIVSAEPADLSGYKIIHVHQFKELLKLAINLNKHILCFHNNEKAEFCAFADGYAFCLNLIYGVQKEILERDSPSALTEATPDTADDTTDSLAPRVMSTEMEKFLGEISAVVAATVLDEADSLAELVTARVISMESEAFLDEIDAAVTEVVLSKELKPYIEYINRCRVTLWEFDLGDRLHGYKSMIDTVASLYESSARREAEVESLIKKLENFKPRLQVLIEKTEEAARV